MKPRAVSYIAYGQLSLAVFLAVCVALHPGYVLKADEGGMSNYGIHSKTAAAYTLALGLPALFSLLSAHLSAGSNASVQRFRILLRVYGWLLLLTLVSTYIYSFSAVLKDVHIVFGASLTVFETAAAVWLFRILRQNPWDRVFVVIQISSFLFAVLTIVGLLHVLFLTEVLTSGAFAMLLVRAGKKLEAVASVR
jgi:hypothetical protein